MGITIAFTCTLGGSVADFDQARQALFRANLGVFLGVGANEISLLIAAGSVVVTSSITSTNPTIANRVETRLQSIEQEGPARLQSILDPVGNQFAVLSVQPPVRTDPFGRMVSEPVGNSSSLSSSVIIIVILTVVILALGGLLLWLVWYRNRGPKRSDEPGPASRCPTIVAPTGRSSSNAANAVNDTHGVELSVSVQPATSARERPSPYPIVPPSPRAMPSSAEELAAAAERTARIEERMLLARNVLLALGIEGDPTGAGGAPSSGTPITLGGVGCDSLRLALSTPSRSAPPQPPSPTSWRMAAPPPPPLSPQPVDGLAAVMAASHLETSLPTAEAWCALMGVFSVEMLMEVGMDSDLIEALALRPAQAKLLKLRLQRGSSPPPVASHPPQLKLRSSPPPAPLPLPPPAASATAAQVEGSDATIKAPAPPPKYEGAMAKLVRKLSFEKKKPQQGTPVADAPAADAPGANVPAARPRSRRKPRSRPQIEDSEVKVEVPAPPPKATLEMLVRKLSFEKKKKLEKGEIAAAEVDDLMQRTLSQGKSKGKGKDVQPITHRAVAPKVEKPIEKVAPAEAPVKSPAELAAEPASPPFRSFTGYSPEPVLYSPLRRMVTFGPGPLGMWLRDGEGPVTILHVVPGSQAALHNVVVGSVIVSVAGRPIDGVPRTSVTALMKEAMKRAAEKPMVLELEFTVRSATAGHVDTDAAASGHDAANATSAAASSVPSVADGEDGGGATSPGVGEAAHAPREPAEVKADSEGRDAMVEALATAHEDEPVTYVIAAESAPDVSELLGESVSAGDPLTDELLAALRAVLEIDEDVLDEQLRSQLLADGFVDERRLAPPFVPPAPRASPAGAKPAAPAATTAPAPTTKEAEVPKVRKEAEVIKATKDAVVAGGASPARLAEVSKARRMSEEHREKTTKHMVAETESGPAMTADDPHADPMSTHKTPRRLSASARDMKLRVLQFSSTKPPDELPTIVDIPRKFGPYAVLQSPAQQSTAATNTEADDQRHPDVATGDWLQLISSRVSSELPHAAPPASAPPMTETEMNTVASTTPYASRLERARAASATARARALPELLQSRDASPVRAETALAVPSSPIQDELAAVLAVATYI